MPLINIVIVLIVVGILLWLINRFIPMQGTIKSILNAVVVICVVLWLLNVFGVLSWLPHIRVGDVVGSRHPKRQKREAHGKITCASLQMNQKSVYLRDHLLLGKNADNGAIIDPVTSCSRPQFSRSCIESVSISTAVSTATIAMASEAARRTC